MQSSVHGADHYHLMLWRLRLLETLEHRSRQHEQKLAVQQQRQVRPLTSAQRWQQQSGRTQEQALHGARGGAMAPSDMRRRAIPIHGKAFFVVAVLADARARWQHQQQVCHLHLLGRILPLRSNRLQAAAAQGPLQTAWGLW